MFKNLNFVLLFFIILSLSRYAVAQDKNEKMLQVHADIVSSFVWRGLLVDLQPNIQPVLSFSRSGFEIGSWGSTNFSGTYKEFDMYAQYSFSGFSIGVNDYYWPADWHERNYFMYDHDKTAHIFEGFINYTAADKFPLSIMVSTWFFGDDKYSATEFPDDSSKWGEQRYSTYFELSYPFNISENSLEVFIGAIPDKNAYGNGPGVINAGVTGSRSVKITEHFELPIKIQLLANPQAEKIYMVLGISF